MIYLDTETIVGTHTAVCIAIATDAHPDPRIIVDPGELRAVAAAVVSDRWCAHNAAFDAAVLAELLGTDEPIWQAYSEGRILCTMVGATLRDIRETGETDPRGYALDAVCGRFGVPIRPDKSNPWRVRYGELRGVPLDRWPSEAVTYAVDDVRALRDLAPLVLSEADLARQSAHEWWLSLAGRHGVRTDPERVAVVRARLDAACADAERELRASGLMRPNGSRDMGAIRDRARAAGVTATTPTGEIAVGADALADVADPALRALANYLHNDAHRSRLLPQLERERLTCRYRLAATGRAIASGTRAGKETVGTNVQNLPRAGGYRECLVPDRADHVWIVADFTGLELATVAHVAETTCGPSSLAAALRAGRDGHLLMAAEILRCSYDAVDAAYRGALGDDARRLAKVTRQTAKGPNFGLPGGLGARGLVAYMRASGYGEIGEREAAALIATWHRAFPEFRRYFAIASAMERRGEPVVSLGSGRVRGTRRYTEICNTPFQGLGADVAKAAGFDIARRVRAYGARMAIFAHDEFVISCPGEAMHEVAELVESAAASAAQVWVPSVPLRAEPLACDRWSKSATRRVDASGRLVVDVIT